MKYCLPVFLSFYFQFVHAQKIKLPEPVTNNAVAVLKKNGREVVYSFFGLDSSKQWKGVHKKVFRMDVLSQSAAFIGELPDSAGRLASAASVIRNKAYIAGGYTVYENGNEKLSKQLFIFDPESERFTKGTDLPFAIDDHVQAVWKDSLLYIISGWSDSLNVNFVQVYNPFTNEWKMATPLPDVKEAKLFGGCGVIAGDTIYYTGGAMFEKYYPPNRKFYKGIINQKNPYEIKWIDAGELPGEFRYRAAAFQVGNDICFYGGSNETYNYNAVSYEKKKPVEPDEYCLMYHISTGKFSLVTAPFRVMDLRNIVLLSHNRFAITGGITIRQQLHPYLVILKKKNFRRD